MIATENTTTETDAPRSEASPASSQSTSLELVERQQSPFSLSPTNESRRQETPVTEPSLVLIGLDLGTNTTCIQTALPESQEAMASDLVPSLVGYTSEGILPGIIPGEASMLFGRMAQKYKLHLNLVQPLKNGTIDNLDATRDFLAHLKEQMEIPASAESRAVIGIPANADAAARENMRLAASGIFDKVILIPEPFLAALGSREEKNLSQDNYIDPVCNSMFVDIGAGSTDVSIIQGYYPTAEDQISLPFAGDAVDQIIQDALLATYPDSQISITKCRELKEAHSFVGKAKSSISANVMVAGKVRQLEVAEAIGHACDALLEKALEAVKALIVRADPDSVPDLLRNIIITGGGSMIHDFDIALQEKLLGEGFEGCRVRSIGEDYQRRVAQGASKAAAHAKDHQWQTLLR